MPTSTITSAFLSKKQTKLYKFNRRSKAVVAQGVMQKKYACTSFLKNKTNMPKAPKMAGGGLGSAVSHPAGGQEAKPLKNFDFFSFKSW